jgi:hypothetical protein
MMGHSIINYPASPSFCMKGKQVVNKSTTPPVEVFCLSILSLSEKEDDLVGEKLTLLSAIRRNKPIICVLLVVPK